MQEENNGINSEVAKEALDVLYGESLSIEAFNDLKESKDDNQISDHSMNEQSLIDKVRDRIEEFKEFNGIGQGPELICDKNSDEALPDELSKEDNVPITDNSDRALPDELASEDGVPISNASDESIHTEVLNNEDIISSHNSDAALNLPHLNDEPISSHNSGRFDVGK